MLSSRWMLLSLALLAWTYEQKILAANKQVPEIASIEILPAAHDADFKFDQVKDRSDWEAIPSGDSINLGPAVHECWIRVTLSGPIKPDVFVVVENPVLYEVDLIYAAKGGANRTQRRGLFTDNRSHGSRYFAFDLESIDATQVYLRVYSRNPLQVPIKVYKKSDLEAQTRLEIGLFSALFAILAAFSIYNFLLYFSVRLSAYLYYSGYSACMGFLFTITEGFTPDFIPFALRPLLIHVFSGLGFVALGSFTRKLLLTHKSAPRADKWIKGTIIACFLVPIAASFADLWIWNVVGMLVAATMLMACVAAAIGSLKQRSVAWVYLAAFAAPVLGTTVFCVQLAGWMPRSFLAQHGMRIGIVIAIMLFSQALAMLINRLNRRITAKSKRLTALNRSLTREIAERKRMAKEIEDQRTLLVHTAKMRELGAITAAVAHEVNSPLAVLSMSLERFAKNAENSELPEDYREGLQKFVASSARMVSRITKVVKSLLSYSRDSSMEDPVMVSPQQLVDDLMDICQTTLVYRGVTLNVALIKNEPILCRASDIGQVLLNLVNNAADALKGTPEPRITLRITNGKDCMELRVEDNGPGVPEHLKARLMKESFTTKRKGEGTGLGLGICKMLAERNNASLDYERLNGVTAFVLRFPVDPPMSEKPPESIQAA